MIEQFPQTFDLVTLVDQQFLAERDAAEAVATAGLSAEAWQIDNTWTQEQLAAHVDDLRFPEIVESKVQVLRGAVKQVDEGLVVRPLCWMPDASAETRMHPREAKIRAVYGHAVLVSGRLEGVNGNLIERSEHADSVFCALGVAVETTEALSFYRLFTADDACKGLYQTLSNGRYSAEINRYNQSIADTFWESDFLNSSRDPAKVDAQNELYGNMINLSKRRIREIGATPVVSESSEHTNYIHRELLGEGVSVPKPKSKKGQLASESLVSQLVHLTDVELMLNRFILSQQFDDYLKNSPVVRGWLKS